MSSENKIIKPKTDFQLVLNYSNRCAWKNDSGAGANAASRVDMTFSATDPLSEIVWSPNKGFSLNCVDSSFTDKNTSLYRDIGSSSMVLALLQSVTGGMSTTDKPIDDVFVNPIAVICAKSDISSTDTPTRHPTSDSGAIVPDCKAHEEHDTGSGGNMEKMNTARGALNLPYDQANIGTAIISGIKGNKSSTISDEPQPSMVQNPSPRKHSNGGTDNGVGNQVVITKDSLYTKVEHINEYEGSSALTSSSRSPLEKLESTAENDLQTFNCEATCAATSGVLVSKSNENKNKSQGNEMMLPCDKNLPVLNCPCNSRIHMTRNKGKEKSSSDGDANVSLSKEKNDSHLSDESWYSAGLFSMGKKRCSFQQQLIVGSKRVKKQIQETSHSNSYVQQDSSFMNLISNMMKGFSQSTQDEGKSLALTIANPDHHLLWPDQKLISCNKNQDPEPINTGFKSNFQSIYCPSLKNVGTRKSYQVGEASKDFELGNKEHGIDVNPISCCADNNSLYKQYSQSNKFEVSTGRYDAGPSMQPKIRPINFLNSHENRKNNSVENKICYHLGLSKEKEGMTLHSSSTRQKNNNNENVESYALSERKETDNIFQKSDTPRGLWITRFLPKSTAPLVICDQVNEIGGSQVHSTDCSMLPHSHKRISYLNNCKIEETREQAADDQLHSEAKKLRQNCCINKEASIGLKDDKGNNDHTSKHNSSPITPFPGFRDSEAMASMFARRLGAIKQIRQYTTQEDIIDGGAPRQKLVPRFQLKI